MKTAEQCVEDCERTMVQGLFSRDNAEVKVGDIRRLILNGCFTRCQTDARAEPLEVLRECYKGLFGFARSPQQIERLRNRIDALLADAPAERGAGDHAAQHAAESAQRALEESER